MRLAPESHKHIEGFLREHLCDEHLELPPVHLYSGRSARWLTRISGVLAITFGRRIFIAPDAVKRDSSGRCTVSARLMAHEATHVVQYQQMGFVKFLISYLREYGKGLRAQGSLRKAARRAAYLAIKYECEAFEAEHAYIVWSPPDSALKRSQSPKRAR